MWNRTAERQVIPMIKINDLESNWAELKQEDKLSEGVLQESYLEKIN